MAVIGKRKWKTASGETREAWKLDFTDVTGERHREQFAKKRDAEIRLQDLMAKTSTGTHRPEGEKKTVRDACAAFIVYMSGRHARGEHVTTTYLNTCKQHCQNYLDPAGDYVVEKRRIKKDVFIDGLGDIKLASLTAKRVTEFRDAMREHGAGIVTIRRVLGTLARILQHAIEKDLVTTNVAKGIKVIGTRADDRQKVVPPSRQTLARLIANADEDLKLRIQFAATTGLRASEQWALKWRHIDFESGAVLVDSRVDAYGQIDVTKSVAGMRTVGMGKSLKTAMLAHKAKATKSGADDFVFPAAEGGLTRHTNLTKRSWLPLLKKAEVDDIGWHALRHFAVSAWIDAGLQPKAVQTLAGHASYAITMDRYGHLFPKESHQDAFDRISEAVL